MTKVVIDVAGAIKRAEKALAKKVAKRDALNAEIVAIQEAIEAIRAAVAAKGDK